LKHNASAVASWKQHERMGGIVVKTGYPVMVVVMIVVQPEMVVLALLLNCEYSFIITAASNDRGEVKANNCELKFFL
jgi:hypothetical protein